MAPRLIGICFLRRGRFIDAARVRENWSSLALTLEDMVPDWGEASSDKFRCFLTAVLAHRVRAGVGFWLKAVRRLDVGRQRRRFCAGRAANRPPRGKRTALVPLRPPFSIREHVFVVWHRVHVVTGFVGIGPWGAGRRQPGGPAWAEASAGRRVVPGAEVSQNPFPTNRGLLFEVRPVH